MSKIVINPICKNYYLVDPIFQNIHIFINNYAKALFIDTYTKSGYMIWYKMPHEHCMYTYVNMLK